MIDRQFERRSTHKSQLPVAVHKAFETILQLTRRVVNVDYHVTKYVQIVEELRTEVRSDMCNRLSFPSFDLSPHFICLLDIPSKISTCDFRVPV